MARSTLWETLWRSWTRAFFLVACALGLGYLSGQIALAMFGVSISGETDWLQYIGIAVLLWATLGHPGWDIQTPSGKTASERANQLLYRSFHLLGSYLLAFSVSWPTAGLLG